MKKNVNKLRRVLIIGSGGFISSALEKNFTKDNIKYVGIKRSKFDLTKNTTVKKLSKLIKKKDIIIFIAAQAPVKNEEMLINNIKMIKTFVDVIKQKLPSYILYVSSDAVYSDSMGRIKETSPVEPKSLHGIMHYTREIILRNSFKGKLCIVRPTLVYGKDDPHNGYGPNQFVKLSNKKKDIKIFGNGEEQRDHIWVEDIAFLIKKLLLLKKEGVYNLVTGRVMSFKKIAEIVKVDKSNKKNIKIVKVKRNAPMPHNGWRAFDNSKIKKVLPKFKFKKFIEVLHLMKNN
jgi:nucleoside-diphosphate-sugar epimerase